MHKIKSAREAARLRKLPAALKPEKLMIEIPKDVMAIMTACAVAQGLTVEQNAINWLEAGLKCDVECLSDDARDAINAWKKGANL